MDCTFALRDTALDLLGGVGAVIVSGLGLMQLPSIQRIASRFVLDGDNRWMLWVDAREAIARTWPAGRVLSKGWGRQG